MAVIDLRGSSEGLAQSFANLGKGIADITGKTKEKERRERLRLLGEQQMPQMAAARRAWKRKLAAGEDVGPDPASLFDFTPEEAELAELAFPETTEEQFQREALDIGLGELFAKAQAAEAEATPEIVGAELEEARSRTRYSQRALELGIPEQTAEFELLRLGFDKMKTEFQQQEYDSYMEFVSTLPPAMRARAALAAESPAFLNDIQFRESLSQQDRHFNSQQALQRELTTLANKQDPMEQMTALWNIKRGFLDEFHSLETSIKELGKGDFKRGEGPALVARYNQIVDDYSQFFPNDPFTILDSVKNVWGTDVGAASRTIMPDDLRVNITAVKIHTGEWTVEEAMREVPIEFQEAILSRVDDMKQGSQKDPFANAIEWISENVRPGQLPGTLIPTF